MVNTSAAKREIVGELTRILLTTIAGTGPAATAAAVTLRSVVKSIEWGSDRQKFAGLVEGVAKKVIDETKAAYQSEGIPHRIAMATSALHDFGVTLKASQLSVEGLLSLGLDPARVKEELLDHRPPYLLELPAHHNQVVKRACETFVDGLLPLVPLAPGFSLAFARQVLRDINRIEQLVAALGRHP